MMKKDCSQPDQKLAGHLKSRVILTCLLAVLSISGIAGCGGGGRASIDGYSDASLSDKRIFVVIPNEGDIKLENADVYAYSRGIAEAGAPGRIYNEFISSFSDQLDLRYDSNTVLTYKTQSVGALYPFDALHDFSATSEIDWKKVDAARKEGAIDFLLVFNSIVVQNSRGPNDERGRENVTASFILIDAEKKQQIKSGIARISVSDPRVPRDTYVLLARAVASELPFNNSNY